MKSIEQYARKPELLEIILDDSDIIEEFGEEVIFYMKDYVDINTYFDFYQSQSQNGTGLNELLRKIILNKQGEPVLKEDQALPVKLAVGALAKINLNLGKSKTKSLMSETGNPQS
jgi:hypothetical protein